MPATIQCPICQSSLSPSHRVCPVCGARVPRPSGEEGEARAASAGRKAPVYDPARGEDDLFAPQLIRFPWRMVAVPLLLAGVIAFGLCAWIGVSLLRQVVPANPGIVPTTAPLAPQPGGQNVPPSGPTHTLSPTLFMPTLTPAPPPTNTPLPTETPGPCEAVVQSGDTLFALAARCGHRDYETIIDEILQMNDLDSPESLQIGQTIFVPWPTPTPGPASATPEGAPEGEGLFATSAPGASLDGIGGGEMVPMGTPGGPTLTPTLQPGVIWYTIQPGDTILAIAYIYHANVEILSQLNPEVTFSQCDYSLDSGGPNCIVNLYEGQQIRVPGPTPTPTLSPTPSGSETATPTPTPTYNAPSLLSPGDLAHFAANEMVTLRWVTTGMLVEGEVYLVTITDEETNAPRTATTTETLFIIPAEWQPTDGERHSYHWTVAAGPADGRGGLASVTFATDSRRFTWDSR